MPTTLLIIADPSHPLAHHALRYATAFLASHPVSELSIFFYGDGANTANALRWQPADQPNLTQDWQQLANKHDLRLPVCVSTALARGVTDSNNASRHNLASNNLADGFELVGLGEFATMLASSNKTIQF